MMFFVWRAVVRVDAAVVRSPAHVAIGDAIGYTNQSEYFREGMLQRFAHPVCRRSART
ncbi:hypothetical protein [Mariprofundus ferrooxydans]|uniref:hypothetical protein n=1 Tax=Mariprofundus ferrooxydans TaxID=314344 RepID=UPI0002E2743A|nr:hypothetical protein [Mariprofundus ferrooxydans]